MDSQTHTLDDNTIEELAGALDSRFFKALSEPVRIQILQHLIRNGRSDIASISEGLPQDRSVISRHLQFMQGVGILTVEKITRHVYYEFDGTFFVTKLETILEKIKQCMPQCCASDRPPE